MTDDPWEPFLSTVRTVFAFLVCAVIVLAALALVVGLLLLVRIHLRRIHEVLYLGDHPGVGSPGPEDFAWLGYHGGPVWWDLAEVYRRVRLDTGLFVVFLYPFLAAQAVVAAAHLALAWAGVVVSRLVDAALLAARRIRMVCPNCFEAMSYPSYVCDGCGRTHRDVRPGMWGVFRRHCVCDRALPTLLLLGSADLDTRCPHCDHALEHRPGEAREFVLPLFGAAGAGKTRLAHGLYLSLEHGAELHPETLSVELMGEETERRLRESRTVLSPRHRVAPTPPGRRAHGATLRVAAGRRTLLVQMYDTAGEWFNTHERTEELSYLGRATTFLLVLDPLAVPAVWEALDAEEQRRLAGDRSGARDPERAYLQVRDQVQRQYRTLGAAPGRGRLAVVVTRGDLLTGTSVDPRGTPPERWLDEVVGAANLLRAARVDFGSVEVFVTSAVTGPSGAPDPSLTTLSRWVLARDAGALGATLREPCDPLSDAGEERVPVSAGTGGPS
ncbi:hypothetical protein ABZ645_03415 [Nocardiopsis alba]|uniref:TRAFAC clade GTPase domain-containing protein n=1 Tax=Nocardiopsis alba TaxID=53437 RepID=UPI0033CDA24F